jgi:predicted transcriptional regulator of viral defense system
MAEILWPGETAVTEEAQRRVTRGYVRLDPTVARRGKFVRKWGLRVNAVVSGGEPSERA